jgi:RNA polymerase sigma factor FliA
VGIVDFVDRRENQGDEYVLQHLDLVDQVLAHLRAGGITGDPDELRAFGRQGLVEAAQRYEPEKGTDFRAFAYLRVRGAMLDGLRRMGQWTRRGYETIQMMRAAQAVSEHALEEEGTGSELSPDAAAARIQRHMGHVVAAMTVGVFAERAFEDEGNIIAKDRAPRADEVLEEKQILEVLETCLDTLPAQESEVLRRFYHGGECLDDIAARLGCSRSWASRLHTRAVHRLGLRLRGAL